MHLFLHVNDGLQFARLQFLKHISVTGTVEVTHMSIAESEPKCGIVEKLVEFSLNQVILVNKSLPFL